MLIKDGVLLNEFEDPLVGAMIFQRLGLLYQFWDNPIPLPQLVGSKLVPYVVYLEVLFANQF